MFLVHIIIIVVIVIGFAALFRVCFRAGRELGAVDFIAIEAEAEAKAQTKAEADAGKEARAEKIAEARLMSAQARLIEAQILAAQNVANTGQDIPRTCYTNGNGIVAK